MQCCVILILDRWEPLIFCGKTYHSGNDDNDTIVGVDFLTGFLIWVILVSSLLHY
jgi:hypothetical protein